MGAFKQHPSRLCSNPRQKASAHPSRLTQVVRKLLKFTRRAPTPQFPAIRNIRVMKILNLIHVMVAQAFYSWAMREINPLHPDLPRIMLRKKELEDKAHRIFA
jgi:hypothetical protein